MAEPVEGTQEAVEPEQAAAVAAPGAGAILDANMLAGLPPANVIKEILASVQPGPGAAGLPPGTNLATLLAMSSTVSGIAPVQAIAAQMMSGIAPPPSHVEEKNQPKKKRKKRDPAAPKPPKSGYQIFQDGKRPELLREHPEWMPQDVSRKLGELWRTISKEEREQVESQAAADKARYEAEKASYVPPEDSDDDEPRPDPSKFLRPMGFGVPGVPAATAAPIKSFPPQFAVLDPSAKLFSSRIIGHRDGGDVIMFSGHNGSDTDTIKSNGHGVTRDGKLSVAGCTLVEAVGKEIVAIEMHRFSELGPSLETFANAPMGPVMFLAGGGMIYARGVDGEPGPLSTSWCNGEEVGPMFQPEAAGATKPLL